MTDYFTDRQSGPRARDSEEISPALWGTFVDMIDQRIQDGALGLGFPYFCPDGAGCAGCDSQKLGRRLQAEIPDLAWPLEAECPPATGPLMDLLEFVAANVGQPIPGQWHSVTRPSRPTRPAMVRRRALSRLGQLSLSAGMFEQR